MNNRFEELMAKGHSGRLSPAETEELARMLNAPILDPLDNPPAGFASKHLFTTSDLAGRVRGIEWFARVGEPLTLDLTMPILRVSSWAEATDHCRDGVWENAQLEAGNQLTLWLHQHDHTSYQRWNEFVDQHKEVVVNPLTDTKLLPYQRQHGLDIVIVNSIQWDILSALMENTYLGSGHRSFFFLELLWVYEAGHFPCGWQGDWPDGKLLVY